MCDVSKRLRDTLKPFFKNIICKHTYMYMYLLTCNWHWYHNKMLFKQVLNEEKCIPGKMVCVPLEYNAFKDIDTSIK